MNDDFWKYGFPALAAFLGVAVTKLLEVIAQRRKQWSKDIAGSEQHKVEIDKLAYDQMKYIVEQYQTDVKALRVEVTELKTQLGERDKEIDSLETRVMTLQNQVSALESQNRELNKALDTLRGTAG